MRIYTLTLNPAYDVHVHAEEFVPFHENIATVLSREVGGKGVNISRALLSAHTENTAVVILGAENAAEFRKGLEDSNLSTLLLEVPGRIRENITVHCDNAPETRISFKGFSADDSLLDEIFARICPDPDTIITLTGRIAEGMTMERVKDFLKAAAAKGARIVIDSRSFRLSDLADVKPWLIKPNQEEISAYCGEAVEDIDTALLKARELSRLGIENVMVSMGERGALLVRKDRIFFAQAPQLQAASTIGAGDSSIAGFLAATVQGQPLETCLTWAIAFGSAACLTAGTLPPEEAVIWNLYPQIRVDELKI